MSDQKKSSGSGRTRNFATVVYPESAPENWVSLLGEKCIPAFISPLHDQDINPGPDHEPKKPHYHVLLMYEGVKTVEQVKEIVDLIGGVGLEKVNSIRGYARYLCHLDNPEKHQYRKEDVQMLAGTDYLSVINLATDKYNAIGEMIDFCNMNEVYYYSELLEYSRACRVDWFRVLCDNGTYVLKEYMKSRYAMVQADYEDKAARLSAYDSK